MPAGAAAVVFVPPGTLRNLIMKIFPRVSGAPPQPEPDRMAEETLTFESPKLLSQLYVGNRENLDKVERAWGVDLVSRDDWLKVSGDPPAIEKTKALFQLLHDGRAQGLAIREADFENFLRSIDDNDADELKTLFAQPEVIKLRTKTLVPKTLSQKYYLQFIRKYEVVFGVGPAGTGKTYLAMAAALDAFLSGQVQRIILTRPAVEAGEALGFLPGELEEKIKPYLRPVYDAMFDFVGREQAAKMLEKGQIEIAPLAYMRGRTLSEAFIILDEAQNTTSQQMMMFLTRLGEGSRMVITGDITQVDIPRSKVSGLKRAIEVLGKVPGIKFFYFHGSDVVRHPLVQRIIEAYEAHQHDEEVKPEPRPGYRAS